MSTAPSVSHREVDLEDPLERFLPAGVHAPRWQHREITLLDLAAFAPAGGLCSTVADMVGFLRANFEPEQTNLVVALEDAQRPRRPIGATGKIGLGWHLREEDSATVRHVGAT